MKTIRPFIIDLVLFAVVLGLGGWLASNNSVASNLLLGLSANVTALVLGMVVAAVAASQLAAEKLAILARHLLEPIAQLREDGTISGHAARRCVVCAVALISPDQLADVRSTASVAHGAECGVCALQSETTSE